MKNQKMKPGNFTEHPYNSIAQLYQAEVVARNIMVILKRTGNKWRELDWMEYESERKKDGEFSNKEHQYFNQVISHCLSTEKAKKFSSTWAQVQ